jgi:hypothetical protein
LLHRDNSAFPPVGACDPRDPRSRDSQLASDVVAISGQNLHLFQMHWGIDKIARRNENCGNKRLFGLTYH